MIKTPVSYSNKFSNITDVEGCFVAHVVKENKADEFVKRINMHDELVATVKELKAFYDDRMDGNKEHQLSREINELLERCK